MPYLYNASELFVYPSFYEGFGLPPIEAMSCGVPVIGSNCTSVPEVLGNSGLLVDPNNIDELSNSILKILNDKNLKKNLIVSGLMRSSELSWEKTAKQTLSAYNKTLNC